MFFFIHCANCFLENGNYTATIAPGSVSTFECDKYSIFVVIDSNPLLKATAKAGTYNVDFLENTGIYVANFTTESGTVNVSTTSTNPQILYFSIFKYKQFTCSSMDVYIGNGKFEIGGYEEDEDGLNTTIFEMQFLCLLHIVKDNSRLFINANGLPGNAAVSINYGQNLEVHT